MCIAQVTNEPALRNRRIDFERDREDHVLERQARSANLLRRLAYTFAKLAQESLKLILLLRLSLVVGSPFLPIGFLNGHTLSDSPRLAVVRVHTSNRALNGENVLASQLPELKVRASALRVLWIGSDGVASRPRLRWN